MAVAAAAAVAVIGSVLGGIGSKKKADAIKKGIRNNIKDVNKFTTDQLSRSDKLGAQKQTYLEEGDPFTEMGRFIFGDPSQDTLANLRKSQSDFAQLAAGKTGNFTKEVASIVQGALANTFGGPRGSFENLSAKNMLSFRQSGLQSALGLTDFFNRTGSQLTNAKFGILDETFERQLALRQNQLNQISSLRLGKAQQSGVGWTAAGNVANAVSAAMGNYASFKQNETALADQKQFNNDQLAIMRKTQNQGQSINYQQPSYYTGGNQFGGAMPNFYGGGNQFGGAMPNFYGGGNQFGGAMPSFSDTVGSYNYNRVNSMTQPNTRFEDSAVASYLLPPVGSTP